MKRSTWLKIALSGLMAIIVVAGLFMPVVAEIDDGVVYKLSAANPGEPAGAGSPDVEISLSGQYIAVAYYKYTNGDGPVYLKSATLDKGWLTSKYLSQGSDPQLAFSRTNDKVVYVVWKKNGGQAIKLTQCALSADTLPTCASSVDIQTGAIGTLNFPDVAVDADGYIHVAWQNNINQNTTSIQTRRSTAPNNISGWGTPVTAADTNFNQKPALFWANHFLHLAYLNGTASLTSTQVQYRSSAETSHSWGGGANFILGPHIIAGSVHDRFDNPTLTANGTNVYLAWEAHRPAIGTAFSLIGTASTNDGTNWTDPTYIPSGLSALEERDTEPKPSFIQPLPPQEVGLRPSLAISNANPAIAWQQINGNTGACAAVPYMIHVYLASPLTGVGSDLLKYDGYHMIDPDLAVGSSGVHRVYMRANTQGLGSCPPPYDYFVYYQGPFYKTDLDHGEESSKSPGVDGGIYLPFIRRK